MELILIRGLPGSGKSTIAEMMRDYIHLETDNYWMNDGVYRFDISRIKAAHEWCLDRTKFWLHDIKVNNEYHKAYSSGDTPCVIPKGVVVANTFTTLLEIEPYFFIAKEFNIIPSIILCQSKFENIHGVPDDVFKKMRERFQYDVSDLYKLFVIGDEL